MADVKTQEASREILATPLIERRIFVIRERQVDARRALRSQIATSNEGRGGRRYAPYVFTEQGVAMLSGVLHSDRSSRPCTN
jgi:ORF6N domain